MKKLHTTLVAEVGDEVMVRNYRQRTPRWEPGEVTGCETSWSNGKPHNTYTVVLERHAPSGMPIRLYVGDDAVQPFLEPSTRS